MLLGDLINNIKTNRQSLFIIMVFVLIFSTFTLRESAQSGENTKELAKITVGLYKKERHAESYFEAFAKTLEGVLGKEFVAFKPYGNIDALCKHIEAGRVDIAGELSPIEYVDNYRKYKFQPFLGMEYDGKAFYHAVLFAPDGEARFGKLFSSKPGNESLSNIKDLLDDYRQAAVIALHSGNSTSGFYYPVSYLISQKINLDKRQVLPSHEEIYKEVLRKEKGTGEDEDEDKINKYVGGFLADFRYESYGDKYENDANYAQPFVIDKTDPIPNGVFVISKKTLATKHLDMDRLINMWKTVRVRLGDPESGPELTGWRTGVKRDLDLVEEHKKKVIYHKIYTENYPMYLAISISVLVIFASFFACLFLRKITQ